MKARFVYEGVDFERGKDATGALNIGKSRKVRSGDNLNVYFQFMSGGREYEPFRDKIYPAMAEDDEKYDDLYHMRELAIRIISDEGYLSVGTWIAYFNENTKLWVVE